MKRWLWLAGILTLLLAASFTGRYWLNPVLEFLNTESPLLVKVWI